MNAHPPDSLQELDSRRTDSIVVRRLWRQADELVVVAVVDAKTGNSFLVDVRGDERPLDVFHHPYAYAAFHGIPTQAAEYAVAG